MSWQLPDEAFRFLELHAGPRMTYSRDGARRHNRIIVELGSGEGTARLTEFADVISIEHDPAFLGKCQSKYIHAPIVDGWYSPAAISACLLGSYDCLVVDGPPGAIGRLGMLRHLDLFKRVPVLVDDVNRPAEQRLLMGLVEAWGATSFTVHHLKGGRAFATFGWGDL